MAAQTQLSSCCHTGKSSLEVFQPLSASKSLSSRRSFPGPSLIPAPPRLSQPGGRHSHPAASPSPGRLSLESRPGCLSTESIGPGRAGRSPAQRRDSSIYGAREGRGKEEAGRPFPAHTARVTQAPGNGHRVQQGTPAPGDRGRAHPSPSLWQKACHRLSAWRV